MLAAPGFIDWTPYREGFAARLAAATGQPVSIEGDLDLVLLPRPAFNADAVRIGASGAGDFVAIDRLSARLAFLPLVLGNLEFRELVLRRPAARLTRGESGAVDFLIFNRPVTAPTPAATTVSPFDLDIDHIVIDDGALTFTGPGGVDAIALQGMDLVLQAPPGAPITLTGDAVAGATPFTIDAALGRGAGTRPLTIAATLPEADGSARFSGTFTARGDSWDLRGDVTGASASASALLATVGVIAPGARTPQAMQKPFSFSARVRAGPGALAADPLTLDVGGTPVRGAASWTGANDALAEVKLEVGAVALEAWRMAQAVIPRSSIGVVGTAFAQNAPVPPALPARGPGARLDVRIPVLSYRGQVLRNGVVTAQLVQDELTVSEASVEMPAATRARAQGRLRLNADSPFDGAIDVFTGDLRGMLTWLGYAPEGAPGRLGAASLKANVQGTPMQFTLGEISAAVDTSTITGRIGLTRGARLQWTADLAVSALNIDAYRSLLLREAQPTSQPAATPAAAKPDPYGVTPVFATLAGLADVDADVRLQVDAVTYGGVPGGKAGLDVSLKDGTLQMRSASFENVGGATAWFSGGIGGFGVTPRFDDLQFDVSAADPARVGRAFGFEVPAPLRELAPVAVTGVIKGTLAQAEITAAVKAANLSLQARGQGFNLDAQPRYEVNIEAAQPSYAALVKAAGMIWPLATPDPGAAKLSARLVHDAAATKIENFDLRVGDNVLAGTLDIVRGAGVPEVSGTITGISLAADRLWPRPPAPLPLPAARAKPGARGAPAPDMAPWSAEPFDWTLLEGWRGSVQIAGKALSLRGVQVQDFSARIAVQDGVLEIADWQGKVFGAPGQLYLRWAASPLPQVQGEIAFLGGDLAQIASAVNRGAAGLRSAGRADFAGSFRAVGATPAAFAASLAGSGTAKIAATETGSGAIAGILGAIGAANQLEGGGKDPVTMETRFSAAEGQIKIEDATVASKSYGGAFTGVIDVGRWLVDLTGRLRLESRTGGDAGRNVTVPMTVKGALDLPNITLRPSS